MDPTLVLVSPDSQTRRKKIPCRQELLVLSLQKFYNTCENKENIITFLEGEGPMSLRLIDWFVTNYSKKKNVIYYVNDDGNMRHFNVYLEYKQQLGAFNKEYFDPFNRSKRIFLIYDGIKYEITIGKLNFLKWADQFNILNYVTEHLDIIFKDMNETTKSKKEKDVEKSPKKSRKPRKELSISALQSFVRHDVQVTLTLPEF